jgi:hypothetical protein
VTKLFRGCRYEVHVYPTYPGTKRLWSRHFSINAARRSFTEAVNNRRGDHPVGAVVELHDVEGVCDFQQEVKQP